MDEQDVASYRQRATDERKMALETSRSNVAAIHLELARQYEALVQHAGLRESVKVSPEELYA